LRDIFPYVLACVDFYYTMSLFNLVRPY